MREPNTVTPLQGHVAQEQARQLWEQMTRGKRQPTKAEFEWFLGSLNDDAFIDLLIHQVENAPASKQRRKKKKTKR